MGNCCSYCLGSATAKPAAAEYAAVSSSEHVTSSGPPEGVAMAPMTHSAAAGDGVGGGAEMESDWDGWQETDGEFEQFDAAETEKEKARDKSSAERSEAIAAVTPIARLPSPAPLPAALPSASPVPMLEPPTAEDAITAWPAKRAPVAAAPAPPKQPEIDLFAGMSALGSTFVEPARVAPKPRPSQANATAASSNLTSATTAAASSSAAAVPRSTHKFDLDRLMSQQTDEPLVGGWGDETAAPASKAAEEEDTSALEADLDIDLGEELRQLGIELDGGDASHGAAPAAATSAPAKPATGSKAKVDKKGAAGGAAKKSSLLAVAAQPLDDNDDAVADIDIDLDML